MVGFCFGTSGELFAGLRAVSAEYSVGFAVDNYYQLVASVGATPETDFYLELGDCQADGCVWDVGSEDFDVVGVGSVEQWVRKFKKWQK